MMRAITDRPHPMYVTLARNSCRGTGGGDIDGGIGSTSCKFDSEVSIHHHVPYTIHTAHTRQPHHCVNTVCKLSHAVETLNSAYTVNKYMSRDPSKCFTTELDWLKWVSDEGRNFPCPLECTVTRAYCMPTVLLYVRQCEQHISSTHICSCSFGLSVYYYSYCTTRFILCLGMYYIMNHGEPR